MLRIESRSVTGKVKIVEDSEWVNDHGYQVRQTRNFNTFINQTFASMFGKPVYEIEQVSLSEDADKYSEDYRGPEVYKYETLATGFDSPEDALAWMEDNRDKWDTNA